MSYYSSNVLFRGTRSMLVYLYK